MPPRLDRPSPPEPWEIETPLTQERDIQGSEADPWIDPRMPYGTLPEEGHLRRPWGSVIDVQAGPFDEFLREETQAARSNAALSVEDNPDIAARALELSTATGVPAPIIHGDMDNFEQQLRAGLTTGIVDDNKFIQQYINDNPLAAKVSNDDWSQLDAVSRRTRDLTSFTLPLLPSLPTIETFAEGFKTGVAEAHGPEQYWTYREWLASTPLASAQPFLDLAVVPWLGLGELFMGVTTGGAAVVAGKYRQLIGQKPEDIETDTLTHELALFSQFALMFGPLAKPTGLAPTPRQLQLPLLEEIGRTARPYVEGGEKPPVGLHPLLDALKGQQAQVDLKKLRGALQESLASTTRERSPQSFADFIRQHTNGELGIPSDAIRALYGDKVPDPGDGILGWIPKLREQLDRAVATGDDVRVPIADWLAKVDPQVATQLEAHIRVRPGGMTVAEAAEPKPLAEPPAGPIESVRKSSGLLPRPHPVVSGITKEIFERNRKLVTEQATQDREWYAKKALDSATRRQTKEWKENAAKVREEVVEAHKQRPDLVADQMFRDGTLYGQKLGQRVKLDEAMLTDEQKAGLPDRYYSKQGVPPDDLATILDYPNGEALINDLIRLNADRKASGLRPMDYTRKLIADETNARMEARYGRLEENILQEAKEIVLSKAKEEELHNDALIAAIHSGLDYDAAKESLKAAVAQAIERFENSPLRDIRLNDTLANIGRIDRRLEGHLLKEDWQGALVERERKYIAGVLARRVVEIEKLRQGFLKTAKPYLKNKLERIDQATANYVQGLLSSAGLPGKLSPKEIAAGIEFEGQGTLRNFTNDKRGMGWEPEVSDRIMDIGPGKLSEMSVADFRELKDAVDSLNYIGRQEKIIEIQGQAIEWAKFQDEVIANLEALPVRKREGQGRWLYRLEAALTKMEEIVKDLDLRKELGPLYRAIIEPMMLSKAKEYDLVTDLANHFKDLQSKFTGKWRRSLGDSIPQDFLIDPYYGAPFDLTRENLINIMLNWGNASNIEKLSRGYASLELGRTATKAEGEAFAARIKDLIDRHATKEDWDFVQAMWEPFKKWQPMADTVSRNVSGVVPKWIDPVPVETPFGTVEGGYWPVKYDRLSSNMEVINDRKGGDRAIFGPDYFRAATPKGHLKERTGYVDFVDINHSIEQAAGTMQQTMHDIAFRDSIVQAARVLYDKKIRAAIRKHMGQEYEAQLIPWLKRVANKYTANEQAISFYNDWQRRVRINLIGSVLPLNLKVMLSPDIGVPNPKAWAAFWIDRRANRAFVMEKSDEIRHLIFNLDRDFREQLEQAMRSGRFSTVQLRAVEWGFGPIVKVTQEFRMITFLDQFNKAKGRGLSDYEAGVIADSYVRERHGAASVVDLPAIMNSNETMKSLTTFYTYFNTMYNWQRQLPGNIRRGEYRDFAVNALGSIVVGSIFGAALFNRYKKDDSWFKIIGEALALQVLSTVPIVREAANYWLQSQNPRTPTMAMLDIIDQAAREAKRAYEGKKLLRPIQNIGNVIGIATGLPMTQVSRTTQFLYDVQMRKQKPKNILDWWRGIINGRIKMD